MNEIIVLKSKLKLDRLVEKKNINPCQNVHLK